MCAPAEFGRLEALRHEPLDGPGVDEGVERLALPSRLRIALRDVHPFHPEVPHQPCPAGTVLRRRCVAAGVAGEPEQGLLQQPGHHAGVGAAARHRGRPAWIGPLFRQHRLAQGIVRPLRRRSAEIEVVAGPGLDHGIDVGDTELPAEPHDLERTRVDREVDAKPLSIGEKLPEERAIVLAREGMVNEMHPSLLQERPVRFGRLDHVHIVRIEGEMALDERQRPLPDRSEADDDHRPVDPAMVGVALRHLAPPVT